LLARSSARMYCGAGAIVAVAFMWTLPVAGADQRAATSVH
jgi:hypothetical protein